MVFVGINSILLLISYFSAESVKSIIGLLGYTPTELRAQREQTLSFLLTEITKLIGDELYGHKNNG